jgi:hypothetical protein
VAGAMNNGQEDRVCVTYEILFPGKLLLNQRISEIKLTNIFSVLRVLISQLREE